MAKCLQKKDDWAKMVVAMATDEAIKSLKKCIFYPKKTPTLKEKNWQKSAVTFTVEYLLETENLGL